MKISHKENVSVFLIPIEILGLCLFVYIIHSITIPIERKRPNIILSIPSKRLQAKIGWADHWSVIDNYAKDGGPEAV